MLTHRSGSEYEDSVPLGGIGRLRSDAARPLVTLPSVKEQAYFSADVYGEASLSSHLPSSQAARQSQATSVDLYEATDKQMQASRQRVDPATLLGSLKSSSR